MKENIKKICKSPEEIWNMIKEFFNKDRTFIFVFSIICGIITHFLLLTNLIFSQDGLYNGIHYSAGGYEATLGRWGIDIFDSLRNNIAFPFITTLISIVIMSIMNIFVIELFDIKGKLSKILSLLAIVVSPCLCMTLLYAYTADVYFYSMFFSVFTVYSLYKIKNKKLGYVLGAISFIFMLSTYQSYMGLTVGLILMLEIKKLFSEPKSSLEVFKELVIKALFLITYVIEYYIATIVILKFNHLSLSSYGGANGIGISSIFGSLGNSIKTAYIGFIKYFFADGVILNRQWHRQYLYLAFFGAFGISIITLFIKGIKGNDKKEYLIRFIFGCALIAVLPIALNLVVVAAPGNEIYYLTATQMAFMIPFAFMIIEMMFDKDVLSKLINWLAVLPVVMILVTYFLTISVTYETLDLSYNQAKSIAQRVITRMEEYPGYRTDMKKLFAGVVDDTNFPKTMDIYNYAITNSLRTSIFHATYWGHKSTWNNFYNLFFGDNINFCDDYEYYTIIHSDEFKEMGIFPAEDSIKMINDVMVVKFTNSPENPPPSQELMEHGIFMQ